MLLSVKDSVGVPLPRHVTSLKKARKYLKGRRMGAVSQVLKWARSSKSQQLPLAERRRQQKGCPERARKFRGGGWGKAIRRMVEGLGALILRGYLSRRRPFMSRCDIQGKRKSEVGVEYGGAKKTGSSLEPEPSRKKGAGMLI